MTINPIDLARLELVRSKYRSGLRNCGCNTTGPDAPQTGIAPTTATLLTNGGVAPGDRLSVFGGYADGMPRVKRGGVRRPVRGDAKLNLSALLCAHYTPSTYNEGDPIERAWVWLKTAQALTPIALPLSPAAQGPFVIFSNTSFRHEHPTAQQTIVQIYGILEPINPSLVDYPINTFVQPGEDLSGRPDWQNKWDFFTLLIENGKVTQLEATRRGTLRNFDKFSYSKTWDPYLPYLLGVLNDAPPIYQDQLKDLSEKELDRSTVVQGKLCQVNRPDYPRAAGNFFSDNPRQYAVQGGSSAPTTLPIDIDNLGLNKLIGNAWQDDERWNNWINDSKRDPGSFTTPGFSVFSLKFNNQGWSIAFKIGTVRAYET